MKNVIFLTLMASFISVFAVLVGIFFSTNLTYAQTADAILEGCQGEGQTRHFHFRCGSRTS